MMVFHGLINTDLYRFIISVLRILIGHLVIIIKILIGANRSWLGILIQFSSPIHRNTSTAFIQYVITTQSKIILWRDKPLRVASFWTKPCAGIQVWPFLHHTPHPWGPKIKRSNPVEQQKIRALRACAWLMGFIFQLANAHELAPRCMMQSFTVTTRKSRYPSQKSPNRGPHPLSAAGVTLYPPGIMAQSSMAGGFYVMTRVPPVVKSQTTTKGVFSLSIFCFLVLKQQCT